MIQVLVAFALLFGLIGKPDRGLTQAEVKTYTITFILIPHAESFFLVSVHQQILLKEHLKISKQELNTDIRHLHKGFGIYGHPHARAL